MIDERKTLKELLTDPLIAKIAPDAIRFMDLSKEDLWEKSLEQLRKECFGGDLAAGFERLFEAARSGEWYYPLYTEEECAENADRKGTNLVWMPSGVEGADSRPFILLVPGGGFVSALPDQGPCGQVPGGLAALYHLRVFRGWIPGMPVECSGKGLCVPWHAEAAGGVPGVSGCQLEAAHPLYQGRR